MERTRSCVQDGALALEVDASEGYGDEGEESATYRCAETAGSATKESATVDQNFTSVVSIT